MTTAKTNTNDLIKSLSGELAAVKVFPHPLRRIAPLAVFALLYLTIITSVIGLRGDIAGRVSDPIFLLELILMSAISISAALCSSWLCTPDMRGQKWMLAVPTTLSSIFLIWVTLRIAMESTSFPIMHWHSCYAEALIFGITPAISMMILSIKGKTTHPYIIAAMNTLAIGSIGYIGLRLVCAAESIGHLAVYHIMPYLLFGFIVSLIAQRIYRW